MRLFRDTWLMFDRSMRLTLRNPAWPIVALMQPILYLAFFGPLLNSIASLPGFPPGGAFNVFVPGLLVMTALFGSTFVGFGFLAEMRAGVFERMRVTPMSRLAMLLGRTLRDVVIVLVQGLILIVLSVPFGLRIDAAGLLVALAQLALIGLALGPMAYVMALLLKSEDAIAPLVNAIALPLMLLSGVMLPMSFAPGWLQTLASWDPLYHAVGAIRSLFNARFADGDVLIGVGVMAALALVALVIGGREFNKAAA